MSKNLPRHGKKLLTLLALATLVIGCQNTTDTPSSLNKPPTLLGDTLQPPCPADTAAILATQQETLTTQPPNAADTQRQPTAPRPWPQRTRYFHNVAVAHPQHYLQGPCENLPEDGYFRTWDRQNALALPAGPAIFLANTILLPVRMAVNPPWRTQTSRDGFDTLQPTSAPPAQNSEMTRNESWYTDQPKTQPMVITQPQ